MTEKTESNVTLTPPRPKKKRSKLRFMLLREDAPAAYSCVAEETTVKACRRTAQENKLCGRFLIVNVRHQFDAAVQQVWTMETGRTKAQE